MPWLPSSATAERPSGAVARPARLCRAPRRRPCSPGRALARLSALAISPDGRNVYVAAAGSNALSVFSRNRRTGALTQLPGVEGCLSQLPGGGCFDGRALNEPVAVAVSPQRGGASTSPAGASRAPWRCDARRRRIALAGPGHGRLHRDLGRDGCASARAMRSPEGLAVSPDGRTVFVAAMRSNAVVVLRRGPEGLAQPDGAAGCIAMSTVEGCTRGHALKGPVDLAISPDGRSVYVAASESDTVASLRSDRLTGRAAPASASRVASGRAGRCARGPHP